MMVLSRTQILAMCLTIVIHVACARSPKQIVRGEFARVREFPHLVLLQDNSRFCGGSIIDATTILTAAHCVIDKKNYQKGKNIRVITGINDRLDVTANNVFPVTEIFYHPEYSNKTSRHDIAIAKLAKPIPFTASQKPIKLSTRADLIGKNATAMGWGAISWNEVDESSQYPRFLQKTSMTVLSLEECKWRVAQQRSYTVFLYPETICALPKAGSGICFGDSGSSLTYENEIIGVASGIIPCAKGFPDFYVQVSYYLPWIKKIMSGGQ